MEATSQANEQMEILEGRGRKFKLRRIVVEPATNGVMVTCEKEAVRKSTKSNSPEWSEDKLVFSGEDAYEQAGNKIKKLLEEYAGNGAKGNDEDE